jgi:hypothetical protein
MKMHGITVGKNNVNRIQKVASSNLSLDGKDPEWNYLFSVTPGKFQDILGQSRFITQPLQFTRQKSIRQHRITFCYRHYTNRRQTKQFFLSCLDSPSRPRPPIWGFSIIFRHNTLGRNHLDEGSARRRDLYLKVQKIHKRDTSMPRRDSSPQSQHASDRRPTPKTAWLLGLAHKENGDGKYTLAAICRRSIAMPSAYMIWY